LKSKSLISLALIVATQHNLHIKVLQPRLLVSYAVKTRCQHLAPPSANYYFCALMYLQSTALLS